MNGYCKMSNIGVFLVLPKSGVGKPGSRKGPPQHHSTPCHYILSHYYVSAPTTKTRPSALTTSTGEPYYCVLFALVMSSSGVPMALCPFFIFNDPSTTESKGLISWVTSI